MSTEVVQKDAAPNFRYEIKCMLYSFGDTKHPNAETVTLIEKIVHTQITEIVTKAAGISQSKGSRALGLEDIFFLLRKNTAKLQTLLRHLQIKEMAKAAKVNERDSFDLPPAKKKKFSLDFLNQSDQTLVESCEQDVHLLQRMDEITKDMNQTDYNHYTRCRRVNFHKSTAKFSEWLGASSLTDSKLSQEVIEVLGYLAYEIVREIVTLSLQVKEDSERTSLWPLSHHHSPPPCTPSQFGATPTFFTTPTDPTGHSPPVSPLPLPPDIPQSDSQSVSRRSQRKQVSLAPLTLGSTAPLTQHVDGGGRPRSRAILPKHVREALRRYNYETGPMSAFSTHYSKPTFYKRTLCT